MTTPATQFPTDPTGLPEARPPEPVELADGDRFDLRIAPVAKRIGGDTVRMLAYNGSIPGPVLKVPQGSEIVVDVENRGDLETTVHWHGLRLESRFDGTHETQRPMGVGERYSARVAFPDPGAYWYHPHIREDYAQELGLYGNVIVEPDDPGYWPPAHRELALTLDDVLVEDGRIAPFSRAETTHSAMGRFGNVMLVNGETDLALTARTGEVVRLYLTNTANTRVFRVALPGARMKLVGGDSGHVEREEMVEDVLLAPSERAVVDVLFERPGELTLEHRTPQAVHALATVTVADEPAEPGPAEAFGVLRVNADMAAERERAAPYLEAEPDQTLSFLAEMDMGEAGGGAGEHGHHEHHQAHAHGDAAGDGIEWEDEMADANRLTTPSNTRWRILDPATGRAPEWAFRVGDRVKIRLRNEMAGDHPMHHPFHVHGAGRFLVLSRDGAVETNLVWSDTVFVRAGETVDILLDVTNAGRWMAHCHIAEHHESGMTFSFDVAP
ncbi:MAG: multicopper oxidase family protein [Actinomycetota bacterium]|nr:multicopper oxidase family protein [Actinomycetota bacterium]